MSVHGFQLSQARRFHVQIANESGSEVSDRIARAAKPAWPDMGQVLVPGFGRGRAICSADPKNNGG